MPAYVRSARTATDGVFFFILFIFVCLLVLCVVVARVCFLLLLVTLLLLLLLLLQTRYAAYTLDDGSVIGDRANLELTKAIIDNGWVPPSSRGHFDVLPIIFETADKEIRMFDIPPDYARYELSPVTYWSREEILKGEERRGHGRTANEKNEMERIANYCSVYCFEL